ncbi:MAG: TRAP transporter small permease [Deltaproteobacteria bacterium]|nr:TRAP transporter small permease [Deltaproteobacteria bacterium]
MSKDPVFTLYTGIKKVNLICATIAGIIILFVNFSIFLDVFLRYFFKSPSIWITEISTYLFLYIIFLATPYALQKGQHIRVTFLRHRLNPAATRALDLLCSILAMTFCSVLLWQASSMTWTAFTEKWASPTVLSAPLAYVYVVMVVGSTLLLATFLLRAILEFRGRLEGEDEGENA